MADKLTFEWSYTPAVFFEEPLQYDENGCAVEIGNGQIIATASGVEAEQFDNVRRDIFEEVTARFRGAQLINHQPFQLSDCKTIRTNSDGSVGIGIAFGETLRMSVGRCDIIVGDAAGNITTSTKKDRVQARKDFARRASKYRNDSVVSSLLKSYDAAVNDPQNEFTHLYEIREALARELGGQTGACSVLGITKNEWSEMGRLANTVPITQGRHRGDAAGQLRDATPAELGHGRRIAKLMVERYFDHLDRLVSASPT